MSATKEFFWVLIIACGVVQLVVSIFVHGKPPHTATEDLLFAIALFVAAIAVKP